MSWVRAIMLPYVGLPPIAYWLCLGQFINRTGTMVVPFLALYLVDDLGMPKAYAPLAMACLGTGGILAQLTGGHLADFLGRRITLIGSLWTGSAILVGLSFIGNPWLLLGGVTLFATVMEMYRPASSALMADHVPPARRAHAFGLMYVAINLGFAVGPALGGQLAKHSYSLLFYVDALTSSLFGLVAFLALRGMAAKKERPTDVRGSGPDGADSAKTSSNGRVSGTDDAASSPVPSSPSASITRSTAVNPAPPAGTAIFFKKLLSDRLFLTFCAGTLLMGVVFQQGMTTLPLYLKDRGVPKETYGLLIALNGLLIALTQMPITHMVNRFPRGIMLALASAVIACGFAMHGLSAAVGWSALAVIVWTIGEMMQSPFLMTIVADLAPTSMRGRYMGVFGMTFAASTIVASLVGAMLLGIGGGRWLWPGITAIGLASAAVYFSIATAITRGRDGGT